MHDEGESSDDDFGPMPVATTEQNRVGNEKDEDELMPKKKKARRLDFEKVFLENLPDADCYEHSFMHRDIVTHVAVSKTAEFVMTASTDGHVKFWKKMLQGIEFVKHYQAHLGPIHAFLVSGDEKMLVTTSEDKMIKFFEIVGFDMSNMIAVEYVPTAAAWLSGPKNINDRVAIADKSSGDIRIYKSEGSQLPIHTILVHASPVRCMASCPATQAVISADSRGIIEIWDVESYQQPASASGRLAFQLKSDTDLYDLAKHRAVPYSLAASPSGQLFATYSSDKQVRIFDFKRGKLTRQYDEAVSRYTATTTTVSVADPEDGRIVSVPMDSFELGKRQATERELEASPDALALSNIVFDESGNFLIFGTLKGIKIVNVVTNKVARVVGNGESGERFLAVALYQGVPKVDTQLLLSRAGGSASTVKAGDSSGGRGGGSLMGQTVDEMNKAPQSDPTIFCTAFKRRRFYCFSRREPDEEAEARDKFNEMPSEEERALGGSEQVAKTLSDTAVLRTSLGDIHIKLFPQECPRTIENFVTHIRNGYYNNLIFHRVIKGFMVQTGDPRGDGTGGESIWGGEFEDEIVKSLKHDRPFTVSMANAGPGTNGSQFFITTVATPWLDGKHTVFGRVTGGFEVVQQIEGARVNKLDKPYNDIKILSAEA